MQGTNRLFWRELALSLFAVLLIYSAAFFILVIVVQCNNPLETERVSFVTPIDDRALLTEQEKIWAQETGVASYHVNGELYVDYGLPLEYWSTDGNS